MKILLICFTGSSTSVLVRKMQLEAKKQNIKDITITALSFASAKSVLSEYDVILIGPQIRHLVKQIKGLCEPGKPIDIIPPMLYGMIDAKGILKIAIDLTNK